MHGTPRPHAAPVAGVRHPVRPGPHPQQGAPVRDPPVEQHGDQHGVADEVDGADPGGRAGAVGAGQLQLLGRSTATSGAAGTSGVRQGAAPSAVVTVPSSTRAGSSTASPTNPATRAEAGAA
ncbi:hypothetical protein WY02_01025 [Pseudonocardia sp. AL041005-10]|nr:hypothetical protein WY02_01025 [Pseudonocardia sp. AL041005-10]